MQIEYIGWKIINYLNFSEDALQLFPNQGHCNLNYLLKKGDKKFHVRKFRLTDRDRKIEYKIQKEAHKKKIAAKPLYLDEQMMIGEFIEGVHQKNLSKKELRALAIAVKKLHKINFRVKPIRFSKEVMRKSKQFKQELVLSHGDLNFKNVFFSQSVKFIDWEYAGVMDKYFDLATVCKEFGLNFVDERYFLRAYGGRINFKKLEVYKEIYEILSQQWFEDLERGKLEFLR